MKLSRTRLVVAAERARRPRRPPGPQRVERRLGREPARLDRVVDPLQRRHVDDARRRRRTSSSPGACSRFGSARNPPSGIVFAPQATPLAALEDLAHERVRLQLLEQVVHRELGVAVVEPDDHAERDHVVAHRVDERAAELAVLRAAAAAASPSCGSTRSSGFATFQTSFTPSAQTCGFSPCEPEARRSRRRSGGPACPRRAR